MSPTSYRTAPPRDRNDPDYDGPGCAPAMSGKRSARSRRPRAESGSMPSGPIAQPHPEGSPALPPRGDAARCDVRRTCRAPRRSAALSSQRDPSDGRTPTRRPIRWIPPIRIALRTFGEFLLMFAAVSRSLADPEITRGWRASSSRTRSRRTSCTASCSSRRRSGRSSIRRSTCAPTMSRSLPPSCARRGRERRSSSLPDLTRNFGAERAMRHGADSRGTDRSRCRSASRSAAMKRGSRRRLFADVFAYARAEGLRCVAHAGEADGPQSVRAAVELLGAERIGHGIAALRDPTPWSNCSRSSGSRSSLSRRRTRSRERRSTSIQHPYVDLDRRGCVVTIDCDDPTLFGTSIEAEYALVEGVAGAAALERYVRNAIRRQLRERPGEADDANRSSPRHSWNSRRRLRS